MINLSNFLIPFWLFSNSVNPPKVHHFIASGRKPMRIVSSTTVSTSIDVTASTAINLMKMHSTLGDEFKRNDVSSSAKGSTMKNTDFKSSANIGSEVKKVTEEVTDKTTCSISTAILNTEDSELSSLGNIEAIKFTTAESFENTLGNNLNISNFENSEKSTASELNTSTKSDLNTTASSDTTTSTMNDLNTSTRSDLNTSTRSDLNTTASSDTTMSTMNDLNTSTMNDLNTSTRSDLNTSTMNDLNTSTSSDLNSTARNDLETSTSSDLNATARNDLETS
ncbi:hypothetical protein NPIL_308021, partial [Nephila pilipes]